MAGMNPRGRPHQADRIADDSTTPAADGPGTADRDRSLRAVQAAFYGRTAHAAGTGDSQADRCRQLALCRAAAASCGARATAEFFDQDCQAGCPWPDRPQGLSLLAALAGPGRPAGAVVIADPWRLLPRRPAPGGTGILAQLAFRRVQLVLADSGMVISSAREYALLGRLLLGRLLLGPHGGQKVRGSQPGKPAAGLSLRPGEAR
jgi:hypothetical protein